MSYHYLFPSVMRMKVEYSNIFGVFQPLGEVSGTVIFECDRVLHAKFITATCQGCAFDSFLRTDVSTRGGGISGATVEYFKKSQVLWTANEQESYLSKGTHRFPFSFLLPANIPPSLEAMNGSIRYQIRVDVDNQLVPNKIPFTVNPRADLNQIPAAREPIIIDKVKEIKSALRHKGEVILKGHIEKAGFCPGEEITVYVNVTNHSNEKFSKAELKLYQRVLLRGAIDITSMPSSASANMISHLSDETQEIRKVAKSAELVQIAKSGSTQLKLSLRIPSVPQSFDSCAIIKLEYFLKIKIKCSSKLLPSIKTEVPIIIGTIPLMADVPSTSNLIDLSDAPPEYSEIPCTSSSSPMTYSESVFGQTGTTKETYHLEAFAPRYPFYNSKPGGSS